MELPRQFRRPSRCAFSISDDSANVDRIMFVAGAAQAQGRIDSSKMVAKRAPPPMKPPAFARSVSLEALVVTNGQTAFTQGEQS